MSTWIPHCWAFQKYRWTENSPDRSRSRTKMVIQGLRTWAGGCLGPPCCWHICCIICCINLYGVGVTLRFFQELKSIYRLWRANNCPILSTDGTTLLTEPNMILERWKEHFVTLLNHESSANDQIVDSIEQRQFDLNSNILQLQRRLRTHLWKWQMERQLELTKSQLKCENMVVLYFTKLC